MKWGTSPNSEMPHFLCYFSRRVNMVCLRTIFGKGFGNYNQDIEVKVYSAD